MTRTGWHPRTWSRPAQAAAAGGLAATAAAGVTIAIATAVTGPAAVAAADAAAPTPSATPTLSEGVLVYPLGGRAAVAIDVDWDATLPVPATPEIRPLPGFSDSLGPAHATPADSPRFPDSAPATDEVWAAVGQGWLVAIYGPSSLGYADADTAGLETVDSHAYLVSPEGTHYDMWPVSPDLYSPWNLPSYSIDAVYPELGWIVVSGYPLRAETHSPTFVEVRDLRTGELLVTGGRGEGDDPVGERRDISGPLTDGSYVWFDAGSEDDSPVRLTHRQPDGTTIIVPMPPDAVGTLQMHDLGDGTFLIAGSTEFPRLRNAWSYDADTGVVSDASATVRAEGSTCRAWSAADGLILRTCDDPYRSEYVDLSGTVVAPFTDAQLADGVRDRLRAYAELGFATTGRYTEAGVRLGPIVDVASGRAALSESQCPASGPTSLWTPPQHLGGEHFAIVCPSTKAVYGYDRGLGESFLLIPSENRGLRTALASVAGLATTTYDGPAAGEPSMVEEDTLETDPRPSAAEVVPNARVITPEVLVRVGDMWALESYSDYDTERTFVLLRSPEGERFLSHTLQRLTTIAAWDPRTMIAITADGRSELNIATGETQGLLVTGGWVVGDAQATGHAFLVGSNLGPVATWSPGAGWSRDTRFERFSGYERTLIGQRALGSTWALLDPEYGLEGDDAHSRTYVDLSGEYPHHVLTDAAACGLGEGAEVEPGILLTWCADWDGGQVSSRQVTVNGPEGREHTAAPEWTINTQTRVNPEFQPEGTPLVLETNDLGAVTAISVFTVQGRQPVPSALAAHPIAPTGFQRLREGTYAITYANDYFWATPSTGSNYARSQPEKRVVIVDILTGTVVGDTPLANGAWPDSTVTYVAPEPAAPE